MEVEVIHPYTPHHNDELMLKIGDVIQNVEPLEKGWCHGELRGRQGVFPDNFVRFLNSDSKAIPQSVMSPQTFVPTKKRDMGGRRCKVLFSYNPQHEDELPLSEGDVLAILEEVEEGWWKGLLNDKVGMFPSNFVEEIEEERPTPTPPKEIYKLDNTKAINGIPNTESPEKALEVNGISTKSIGSANSAFHPVHYDKKKDASDESLKTPSNNSLESKTSPVTKGLKSSPSNVDKEKDKITINVGDGHKKIIGQKVLPTAADIKAPPVTPIEQHTQPPPPELPPKPVREWARAIYPYNAEHADELELLENDLIIILCKEMDDKGWWKGELNGKIGVFPDNFVELVSLDDPPPHHKPPRPEKPASSTPGSPGKSPSSNFTPSTVKAQQGPPPPLPGKKVVPPPVPSQKKPTAPTPSADANENKFKAESSEDEKSLTIGRENRLVHMVHNRPKGPANRKPPSQMFLDDCRKSSPDIEQVLTMPSDHNQESTGTEKIDDSLMVNNVGSAGVSPGSKDANTGENAPPWLVELRENQFKKRRSGVINSGDLDNNPSTNSSSSQVPPNPSPLANNSASSHNPHSSQSSKAPVQHLPHTMTNNITSQVDGSSSHNSLPRPKPIVNSHPPPINTPSPAPSHPKPPPAFAGGAQPPPSRSIKPARNAHNEESSSNASFVQLRKNVLGDNPPHPPKVDANSPLSLEKLYNDVMPKIKLLEERLEEQHQLHSRQLKLLMNELDDERKKRACLEIEIERLNKLVSTYAHV